VLWSPAFDRRDAMAGQYPCARGPSRISKPLVQQIIANLRARYAFDDDDVRALGAKLAEPARDERRTTNLAFAERFVADHEATFSRLGQ
jgi:hypothetical protein